MLLSTTRQRPLTKKAIQKYEGKNIVNKIYCDGMDEFELKNQFVIGNSYKVKPMDEVYPVLDDKGNDTRMEGMII